MTDKTTGKKLLLLGGGPHHYKVAKTAQEMGVYVLCTDFAVNSPTKKIANRSYMLDVKDTEALTDLCRRENVDGVLNVYFDPCQRPYQRICERLNYPCFGNHHQVSVLTDKKIFKEFCQLNGVEVIPEYDYEELEDDYSNIEFPVLVKPVDNRGSRGQTLCRDIAEIRRAVVLASEHSDLQGVLLEKYMGRENDLQVSYLVVDGQPHLIRVTDRYLGNSADGLDRVAIASLTPSRFTRFYLDNVNDKVKRMIRNLGIKNGPVFLQGFVDGDVVRFYDPGLRLPGSEFEFVLKKISKIDIVQMLVEFALTGSMSADLSEFTEPLDLDGRLVFSLYPMVKAGIIHRVTGMDAIKAMKDVFAISQNYKEGDEVFQTNDTRQRFCAIVLIAPSLKKLKASLELVQAELKVLDEHGENLIYGFFDTSRLVV